MSRELASAGLFVCVLALAGGCANIRPAEEEADEMDESGPAPDGGAGTPRADGAPVEESPPGDDAGAPVEVTTVLGAADTFDTYLRLSNPTFNHGAGDRICADTTGDDRRILMRFDLAAVGAATVTAATLHIWTGTALNDYSTQIYSAYEMLEGWHEGAKDALIGVASWSESRVDTAWITPGAGPGSRDDVVVGSFTPAVIDTEYTVELDPEVLNRWVTDPTANHGIAIVAAGADGACFNSSEHATAAKRPSLTVEWTD